MLHDELIGGVAQPQALITTYTDDRPAPRLYRRLGWELLVEQIFEDSDLYGLNVRRWAHAQQQNRQATPDA
jgi:hypothetical protein